MAKLSHPNIVAVFDADVVDALPYLVMEYVEGGTLAAWLTEARRSPAAVLDAFGQAGAGLSAAHAAGLVHRDFKPSNVLRRASGRVQVTDFGIAVEGPTASEGVHGTPAYMAPEQHAGTLADARSDQYALCVSLWEALTGYRPFRGDGLEDAKRQLAIDEPADARPLPRRLRALLLRGLSPAPNDRFASMDALRTALRGAGGRDRKVLLGMVGVTTVVGGGFAIHGSQQARLRSRCEAEGQRVEASWDDTSRAALRASLAASGAHNASTLEARVLPWVDDFAGQWSQARTQNCLAAPEPGELHERARDCLDESLERFDATLAALMESDPRLAQRSIKLAAGLGRPRECLDEALLRVRAPLPRDPNVRDALRSIREDRARHAAAVAAGDERNLAQAEALVERARQTQWAPAVIDGLVYLAERQDAAGAYDDARRSALEAFQLALAENYDLAALSATARLVYVVGYGLGQPEQGLDWSRTGHSIARRLGFAQDHPRMSALIANTAVVHWAGGDFEAAKAASEESLALKRKTFGPEHPSLAGTLENYGITLASMGDLDGAEDAFESALSLAETAFGEDHPSVASVALKQGTLALERKRAEQARTHFERARPLILQAYGPDHSDVALVHLLLANVAILEGDPAQALRDARVAHALLEGRDPPHPYLATVLFVVGDAQAQLGEYDDAERVLRESHELQESLPESSRERHDVDTRLAEVLFVQAKTHDDPRRATTARELLSPHEDAKAKQREIDAWLAARAD
jgi:tetratricopeptide (TPR) repeat protein